MIRPRAAEAAKSLLSNASRRLLTPDPTELPEMSEALDASLDWRLGHNPPRHVHGPFEPTFTEAVLEALCADRNDRHVSFYLDAIRAEHRGEVEG